MRIFISFDETEEKINRNLLSKYGGKLQDLIRSLLKEKHDSAFPAYKMTGAAVDRAKEPEMTPEQFCGQFGGYVDNVKRNATFKVGAVTITIPLSNAPSMLKILNEWRAKAALEPLTL